MSRMNHVERFRAVMSGQPVDRLPMWEWAMWWDKTLDPDTQKRDQDSKVEQQAYVYQTKM